MASATAAILARRNLQRCTRTETPAAVSRVLLLRSKSTKPDQSFLNTAYSNLSALRWRIATSLTESLSKEEQKELLDRLDIDISKNETNAAEDSDNSQRSIAEAVAAARSEEARRQESKFEREKGKLLAEAEAASRKRVENELAIQHRRVEFEKWQQQLKMEAEKVSETPSKDAVQMQMEEPLAAADHPVLGTAIADLHYKRVHLATAQVLKSLPIWKKQRTYRHKRALDMAKDKMKTLHLGMPGVIALHEDKNGQLSIIDGQHRVGMMAILEEKQAKGDDIFDLDQILVEVYPEEIQTSESGDESSHAQEIFLEINKAEPVKLVDLPGIALTKSDRKTINEGAKRLEEAFPAMFSASQKCRTPHLNIDNLREALFTSEVVKRHNVKSPKAMEAWMMEQNERLKEEFTSDSHSTKAVSVPKTALQKAIKHDFFLGLDSTWLLA